MNIQLVPVLMVDQIWPQVADYLAEGLEAAPDTSLGWVWSECRAGRAFLFVAHDSEEVFAASVWHFQTWRDGERFKCLSLGGKEMRRWLRLMADAVTAAAKHGGAVAMPYEGREGWGRFFKARKVRALYEVDI